MKMLAAILTLVPALSYGAYNLKCKPHIVEHTLREFQDGMGGVYSSNGKEFDWVDFDLDQSSAQQHLKFKFQDITLWIMGGKYPITSSPEVRHLQIDLQTNCTLGGTCERANASNQYFDVSEMPSRFVLSTELKEGFSDYPKRYISSYVQCHLVRR